MDKILSFGSAIVIGILSLFHRGPSSPAQTTKTVTQQNVTQNQLLCEPQTVSAPSGKTFTVTFNFATPDVFTTQGYKFNLQFDSSKLQLQHIDYKLGKVSADLGQTDDNISTINSSGKMKLQGEIASATGYDIKSNSTPVIALTFISKSSSTSTIDLIGSTNFFVKVNKDLTMSALNLSSGGCKIN